MNARIRSSVGLTILSSFVASLAPTSAFAQPGAPPVPVTAPGPAQSGSAEVAPPPPQAREPRRVMEQTTMPQAAPMSPIPAPTPQEISRRRMSVRIDATRPAAVIERRVTTRESAGAFIILPYKSTDTVWEQVCVTPCSVDLDRFSTYRVRAQNYITGSKNFTLPQNADALHLNVKTGNLAVHRVGELMTGIGFAAIVVGGSLLITASNFRHPDDERIAGGVALGGGILFAAIGLPLAIATNTKVKGDSNEEIANTYFNKGHEVPFLPKVNLGNGFTLTQRGIIF